MEKIFGIGGPLARGMTLLANTICLSIFWIIGCLPIVTIGASTTAAYYAAMQAVRGENGILRNYIKSFKENLKQAVMVELLIAVPGAILVGGVYLMAMMERQIPYGISAAYGCLAFVFLAVVSYIFPLLSYFVFPTGTLFKNAVLIPLANGGWTFLVVLVNLLPLVIPMLRLDWTVMILPLIVALVPGAVIQVNGWILGRIFPKYVREV